jgi:hypothetical protein
MLDQVEPRWRSRFGQLPRRRRRRRRAVLLGDLDHDAMSGARVQKGLPPVRVGQVDADGLDAERPEPGQRLADVGNQEGEVVRTCPVGGEEALQEGRVRTARRRQQLNFRASGELELAPPEPRRVVAEGPGATEDPAEQVPAVGQGRRADGEVIEVGGHGTSRYRRARQP